MSYIDGLKTFPHLIASATGVDANTLATTTLTFANGGTLDLHVPFEAVVEWESGTYTLAVARVKANGSTIGTSLPLNGLASTNRFAIDLKGSLVANTGDLGVEITTINGSAATFTIKVYGITI